MTTKISVLILLSVSTYTDIKENKIKNKILLSFMVAGFIYQCFSNQTVLPIDALLGLLLPIILIPFFVINMLGAGDVKLFMAVGIWVGWQAIANIMIYSTVVGGVVALILLFVRKNGLKRLKYLYTYFKSCFIALKVLTYQSFDDENREGRFPYAIVILLGYISYSLLSGYNNKFIW